MNASEYLSRHGWRGAGYSLHPSGRGIKKPLTTTKKVDVFGVGKKKVDIHADQWWARAFDSGLKDLNLGSVESTSAPHKSESKRLGKLELARVGGARWTGLFDGFVKGESLQGTMDSSALDSITGTGQTSMEPKDYYAKKTADDFGGPSVDHRDVQASNSEQRRTQKKKSKRRAFDKSVEAQLSAASLSRAIRENSGQETPTLLDVESTTSQDPPQAYSRQSVREYRHHSSQKPEPLGVGASCRTTANRSISIKRKKAKRKGK